MGAGRPTKYDPGFNDKMIDLMSEGASIQEVCLELGICKQTFYNWAEQHSEFMDSKKKGEWFSEGWWMREGRKQLQNGKFNYTGWYMNMKNRFGWADKSDVTSGGEPIIPVIKFTNDGDRG